MEILKDFDVDMLTEIWDDVLKTEDDNFDKDKALKEIKTTKIKVGDMFVIDSHRLICGDSTDLEVVKKLTDENKVSMIYFDPPYNINLDYNKGIFGVTGSEFDKQKDLDIRSYAKYVLKNGSITEKRDVLGCLKSKLVMRDKKTVV